MTRSGWFEAGGLTRTDEVALALAIVVENLEHLVVPQVTSDLELLGLGVIEQTRDCSLDPLRNFEALR